MVKAKREDLPRGLLEADFDDICAVHRAMGDSRDELDRIAKALRALEQAPRDRPAVLADILDRGLAARLALILSNEACSCIVGERLEPQTMRALEAGNPVQASRRPHVRCG